MGLLLSLCVISPAPVCARGGEGLQGTERHEFSPYRHSADRDIWAADVSGPRGDPKAVLPFPALMLLSAMLKLQGWDQRVSLLPARVGRLPGSCPVLHGALYCLKGQETLKQVWPGSVHGLSHIKAC